VGTGLNIIVGVIALMLVIGTVFAVVWWRLAEVIYPGTDQKTGQRIGRGRRRPPGAVAPDAKVVTGFDDPRPGE
jgi:hypothetical protein